MGRIHLNRQLILEAPSRTDDSAGGFTETWAEVGRLWAEVKARTGRETLAGGVERSSTSYTITVRAAPHGAVSRPKPDQRFRDGARFYRIASVADRDPLARFLTCFCEEEVAV